MSQADYQVTLIGTPIPGVPEAQARAGLARLFKLSDERVDALLADTPAVIKKGLDEVTARKYRAALQQAGWLAEIGRPATGATPPATPTPAAAPSPVGAPATPDTPRPSADAGPEPIEASLAPVGSLMADPREVPPLEVDLAGITLAEPGAQIGEPPRDVAPLQVDLTGLSMAEPGARLDQDPPAGEGTPSA
jgi:hypothetical protein